MSSELSRPLPWSISDVRSAVLPVVVGFLLLGWAWWDASGTGKLDDQVRSVVFALLGGGAVVAGSIAWLAAGRRAVRIRRSAVVDLLEQSGRLAPLQNTPEADTQTDDLVVVGGTSHYHRADCLLVRGKSVKPYSSRTSRKPCVMCRP